MNTARHNDFGDWSCSCTISHSYTMIISKSTYMKSGGAGKIYIRPLIIREQCFADGSTLSVHGYHSVDRSVLQMI